MDCIVEKEQSSGLLYNCLDLRVYYFSNNPNMEILGNTFSFSVLSHYRRNFLGTLMLLLQ